MGYVRSSTVNAFKFAILLSILGLGLSDCKSSQDDRGNSQSLVVPETTYRPRVLVSTDIGGTDPDDNQSLAHLLMYSDRVRIEGLVSSPSYGDGNVSEIKRMIDLYEQDLPKLQRHSSLFASPEYLRSVTKQGRFGNAPYVGYSSSTEGSDWIIHCARKDMEEPLWVLVWGGLEDLVQALHDAPDIVDKIRVYWIGGPNKKWSANSYAYLVEHFAHLWLIEANATYYGFFSDHNNLDSVQLSNYYDQNIASSGHLGNDFKNYYDGEIKMGDTPSLLYLLHGDQDDPTGESWGGRFEKIDHCPRTVFHGPSTLEDTVAFCSVLEFHFEGPIVSIPHDSVCFYLDVPYGNGYQRWPGYYLGDGNYSVRYIPKQAEVLQYHFTSNLQEINNKKGAIVVENLWPGPQTEAGYVLGDHWYSDLQHEQYYEGRIQGGKSISQWRSKALEDWAKRWQWLREE